jgi:tetratricopeptide (TPR) repeat protein
VKAQLGDFEEALSDANKYIEICNHRPFGLQERGVLKRMMGDLSGALADLNEGLELETDDYERLKHRGLVKFLLKDEDGARADAEWALRIRPPGVESYNYGTVPALGVSSVEYLEYKLK